MGPLRFRRRWSCSPVAKPLTRIVTKPGSRVIKEHGIQITRGFGALRDRVCRIGHMGSEVDAALIDALLAGLRDCVTKRGS